VANLNGVDPTLAAAVTQLMGMCGGITIQSGFRTFAEQSSLYSQAVAQHGAADAPNWVAPPGHSNHEKGLAVDLGGNLDCAHVHAADLGLSFPLSNEPWHIELASTRAGGAQLTSASIDDQIKKALGSQPNNPLGLDLTSLVGPIKSIWTPVTDFLSAHAFRAAQFIIGIGLIALGVNVVLNDLKPVQQAKQAAVMAAAA